jgi:hypothetical protein
LWDGVEYSRGRCGCRRGGFSDECVWWDIKLDGKVIRVELNMLDRSGGVRVISWSCDEETINKTVVCVVVASLPGKWCISWDI